MQESLYNTVQKLKSERKINVEELELILESDIEEVVSLCKKASLKPKTDEMGNAYFTKNDVDVLKKIKELFSQTQDIQPQTRHANILKNFKKEEVEENIEEENEDLTNPNKKINFLTKAKNRLKPAPVSESSASYMLSGSFQKLEDNLINKLSNLLSEKMDGFDEIIVELIRTKTENENLRQKVNELNKEVFNLKKEKAAFVPLPFGLYAKREIEEL